MTKKAAQKKKKKSSSGASKALTPAPCSERKKAVVERLRKRLSMKNKKEKAAKELEAKRSAQRITRKIRDRLSNKKGKEEEELSGMEVKEGEAIIPDSPSVMMTRTNPYAEEETVQVGQRSKQAEVTPVTFRINSTYIFGVEEIQMKNYSSGKGSFPGWFLTKVKTGWGEKRITQK